MKILIIDEVHEVLTEGLAQAGHTADYRPHYTREDVLAVIPVYEGLVVRTKTTVDKNVLSLAVKLKFIARAGAGLDNIDTEFCDSRGIRYFNAGEANADAVGEQTIGMLLSLMGNIVKGDREVRQRIWDRQGNTGTELAGKTVGIIGYGNTGRAVAAKLSGFGVNMLVYDKYVHGFSDGCVQEATMEQVFSEADIVTLHVPLTAETHHMVNRQYLEAFSKPVFLLNLSRGKVVEGRALVDALRSGKVRACALDVLENENLGSLTAEEEEVFGFLVRSEHVVLTPHVGGWTAESYRKIAKVLLQKIKGLDRC